MEPEFTNIIVPYDQAPRIAVLLRRFSNGFDGATDGETTTFRVFNLRMSELVLALLKAEEKPEADEDYNPHWPFK